jgi:hypothetical protein
MPMDKLVRTRIRWWMIVVARALVRQGINFRRDSTTLN